MGTWRIDRRYLWYFDWISFFLTILIATIGLLFVFSATYTPEQPFSVFFKKQLFGAFTGFAIYLICCITHPVTLRSWGALLYWVTMALLVVTLLKGSVGMGAQRWINLGIIKFQPSELTKIFFPAFFAQYVSNERRRLRTMKDFVPILVLLLCSVLLVAKQPDLGTALIILFSGLILLWIARLPTAFYVWSALLCTVSAPILWKLLKPYQKNRIFVFLGQGDARKERYQIEQSCIAVGSGGLWGKGYLRGTQNKLKFLPESRTDFIFSVICEELGFAGACAVLLLYMWLISRLFALACSLKQFSMQILALGLLIPLVLSVLVNVGMVIGLLPIVGIPLPLMSYGVTHAWMTWASLGWINGIAARRFYSL